MQDTLARATIGYTMEGACPFIPQFSGICLKKSQLNIETKHRLRRHLISKKLVKNILTKHFFDFN